MPTLSMPAAIHPPAPVDAPDTDTAPIALIYARAANGTIGHNNAIAWKLPADMAHFRALTQGCPVIMGRKTWDSLPARFRPLPGRYNIVLTRSGGRGKDGHFAGAQLAPHWDAAVALAQQHIRAQAAAQAADTAAAPRPAACIWVIGGAQIYALALAHASIVQETLIHRAYPGDAHAPTLGDDWVAVTRQDHPGTGCAQGGDSTPPYSFIRYERRSHSRPAPMPTSAPASAAAPEPAP